MKIYVNRIPEEGLTVVEALDPAQLDIATAVAEFRGPLKVKAEVTRITNAVTVKFALDGTAHLTCGRCLKTFEVPLALRFTCAYEVENNDQYVDVAPDIREEILLWVPMQPHCKEGCKGLCPRCGKDLNEGGCSCATTKETTF